ncbi:hypothetical protein Bbelb_371500 [Branchiostoma belcheri]|nr:hypothetical protein Bbelb_371500 [Branchiostoma belcheri]
MIYQFLYSIVALCFGVSVFVRYVNDGMSFGFRSALSLLVLFLGEPFCHHVVGEFGGLLLYGLACVVMYIVLPAGEVALKDRVVLITGCDSGFGRALAQHLDSQGCVVFAGCLHGDGERATSLTSSCSAQLKILQLDVRDAQQVDQARQAVQEYLGPDRGLWGLINNAGLVYFGELDLLPFSMVQHSIDVNLVGMLRLTKTFLPLLRKGKGRVINMSSIAGSVPLMFMCAEGAAKAGVQAASHILRQELKKWGVHVSIVQPFAFKTEWQSSESMLKNYNQIRQTLDKDTLDAYGLDYLDAFKHNLLNEESLNEDLGQVIGAMTDALTSRGPRAWYPCGRGTRSLVWLSNLLPTSILDMILPLLMLQIDVTPTRLRER